MNITQSLQKWGNGTGVRLPIKVVKAAKLQLNQPLAVSVQGRSVVLTPVRPPKRQVLDKLVAGISAQNIHSATEWGAPRGREVW